MRLPIFNPDGGAVLIAVHGLAVAGLVAAVGGLVLLEGIVRPMAVRAAKLAPGQDMERGPRRFGSAGLCLALVAMLMWYWLQTADFLGESDPGAVLGGLWPVLRDTDFGHVWVLQIVAASLALLAVGRGFGRAAAGLAALALAGETARAHLPSIAVGDAGYVFALGVGAAHLLGGGFWVGALWPLRQLLRHAPKSLALTYARGFSVWGKVAVVAVAASGLWQAWVLVASLPRLFGTAYGWMVLLKTLLFLVLLGFALFNRYTLAPRLARGQNEVATRAALSRAILMQGMAGIAVLTAAMVLSALPPARDVRPISPFAASSGAGHARIAATGRSPAIPGMAIGTDWQIPAGPGKLPRQPAMVPVPASGGDHAPIAI